MPLPFTVSCFSKIQIGFTFLVPAYLGSPGKRPLNGCVCVLPRPYTRSRSRPRPWVSRSSPRPWHHFLRPRKDLVSSALETQDLGSETTRLPCINIMHGQYSNRCSQPALHQFAAKTTRLLPQLPWQPRPPISSCSVLVSSAAVLCGEARWPHAPTHTADQQQSKWNLSALHAVCS